MREIPGDRHRNRCLHHRPEVSAAAARSPPARRWSVGSVAGSVGTSCCLIMVAGRLRFRRPLGCGCAAPVDRTALARLLRANLCHGGSVSDVEVITSRDVPLGGPRAMTVHRTLPQRARSLVGAWCFADHYGPDDVARTGGMDVPPHPHTGLQTVSWLFTGEIEHRDSSGVHAMVRPGELNLMTGGYGVAHSEVSTRSTTTLHGVQLWVALPDARPAPSPGLRPPRTHPDPPRRCHGAGAVRHAGRPHLPGGHPHPADRRGAGARPARRAHRRRRAGLRARRAWSTSGRSSSTAPSWRGPSWATCRPAPTS